MQNGLKGPRSSFGSVLCGAAGGAARGCRDLRVPKGSFGQSQEQSAAKAPGEMA